MDGRALVPASARVRGMALLDVFRKRPRTLVRVTFHDITEPPPKVHGRGYIYAWPLRDAPQVGQRVLVPGMQGPAWAVVIGVNDATRTEQREFELKDVIRLATADEIAQGQEQHEREFNAWLDMMRRSAGLQTTGRQRKRAPAGYPEIPPAEGTAPPDVAHAYGSAWWRAYKNARDEDEGKRFESLGHRWYAIERRQRN